MRLLSRSTLIATALAIVGLILVVVVLVTSNTTTAAGHHTASATGATPQGETGAKLDHSGRKLQLENQLNRSYFYPGHY